MAEKKFDFHYYNELKDEIYYYPLAREVIEFLSGAGYTLKCKIGAGAESTVFLADSVVHQKQVAILIKGNLPQRFEWIHDIHRDQQRGILDVQYMVKILDLLECPSRLSNHPNYPIPGGTNPIQVLEYIDTSLRQYITNQKSRGISNSIISQKIESDLIQIFKHIDSTNYTYTDYKVSNLMFSDNRVKLIDLDTLRTFMDKPKVSRGAHIKKFSQIIVKDDYLD